MLAREAVVTCVGTPNRLIISHVAFLTHTIGKLETTSTAQETLIIVKEISSHALTPCSCLRREGDESLNLTRQARRVVDGAFECCACTWNTVASVVTVPRHTFGVFAGAPRCGGICPRTRRTFRTPTSSLEGCSWADGTRFHARVPGFAEAVADV